MLRGTLAASGNSLGTAVRFVEFDTQAEVLEAVRQGEADLAIGNMKVVNLLLEQRHVGAPAERHAIEDR